VPDILRCSLPIKRQDLQLPLNRNRSRQETNLAVACLILELSRNRDGLSIRAKPVAKVRCGAYLQVLADAECALENGHALLDRRQIKNLGARVNSRLELHFRDGIDHQVDRLVAFRPRRIHMDVRREPHFRSQRYTAAGNASAVGLLNHELKVGTFNGIRDFFAQFRKELGDHVVARKPLPVFRLEELFPNDAVWVHEEISGSGHPLELTHGFAVENLIGPNNFGVGIGEQGEINLPAVREVFQYFFAVIADSGEFDPLFLESCFGALQLNQLPFAIGSPIRRTEKQENRAVRSFQAFQGLFLAELVASRECGRFLSNGEPNRNQNFEGSNVDCIAFQSTPDRDAISQMACGLRLRVEVINLPDRIVI
jgi:hypothetical protein